MDLDLCKQVQTIYFYSALCVKIVLHRCLIKIPRIIMVLGTVQLLAQPIGLNQSLGYCEVLLIVISFLISQDFLIIRPNTDIVNLDLRVIRTYCLEFYKRLSFCTYLFSFGPNNKLDRGFACYNPCGSLSIRLLVYSLLTILRPYLLTDLPFLTFR